ncbi:MAG: hypothetical protein CVV21_02545 [Candidatus Goldiibacteriota bacterium HGW-Goldbacteria-1]|jgi:CBS domain containing-hemolysin-like protein|nr:MAG: hypothetical protein CVV21_02545 [Candidatus Goldiibacteriota bacterium HGW-Goldbacteria-1]
MEIAAQFQLYIIILLFFVAATLSVAETALIGMSRIKIIAHIKNNHPKAKYLKVWMADPNKLLATLSICVNAVAITTSTIGAFLSMKLAEVTGFDAALVATLTAGIITFIIIIFGEITPKIFAIHNTEKLGLLLVGPIVFLFRILKPITELFVKISNLTIKILGGKSSSSIPVISGKDIDTVIDVSMEAGVINEQEKSMMQNILEIKDTQVKHIMVPRTKMVGIDITWDVDKIIDVIVEDGYSRVPVFKENYDNIVGIVYVKDMLTMIKNRGLIIFHDLIRMPYFVPESKNIGELFKEFKKGKMHMAIVVDEFGGTSGLITIEDILEEIVGEIKDEYDVEEPQFRKLAENSYEVDGLAEITRLNRDLSIDIPLEEDVNTVAGFVMALFGRVPKKGEKADFGNISFTVLKSDAKKVELLKMDITPQIAAAEPKADEGVKG